MHHSADKKQLRAQMLAQRQAIPAQEAKAASLAIMKRLLDFLPEQVAVAGYSATKGEVDIFELLIDLCRIGNPVALPVVSGMEKHLEFHRFLPDMQLVAGRFGILCPPPHSARIVPQVVLVPLVAFDEAGNRLGYGAGYYDVTIRRLRQANKQVQIIGVAYSVQQVATLPVEPHDERLDCVATEQTIIRCA